MVAISRAALVDAAINLNSKEGFNLDPSIDVSLSVGEIRAGIIEAAALLSTEYGDADKISHETAVVINMLRDNIIAAVPRLRERDIGTIGIDTVLDDVRSQLDAIAAKVASQAENVGEETGGIDTEVVETAADGESQPIVAADPEPSREMPTTTESEQAEQPPPPERKIRTRTPAMSKPPQLGRFRPVRRIGHFARILREYLSCAEPLTLDQIAFRVDLNVEKVVAALRKARKTNGIDYAVDDSGVLTIILPEGVNASTVWHDSIKVAELSKKKAVVPKAQRQRRATPMAYLKPGGVPAMFEAARNGEMPAHIVITSPTNLNNQKHFDKLRELADGGDWDGVRSYEANGSNYYAEMIRRYRDLLVIAHEAQQGRSAVAAQ